MRLWELEGGDDGEFGQGFGGGRGALHLDYDSDDEDEPPNGVPQQPGPPPVPPPNELLRHAEPAPPLVAAQNGAPVLQRFLQMAQNDEDDGWDSDEMDELEEEWDQ